MGNYRQIVALAVACAFGIGVTAVAQTTKAVKKARKVLEQVKLVDGPGSGLDADTVQGMTPPQLQASLTPGPQGPAGAAGPPGPQGLAGPQGLPGTSGGGLMLRDANGSLVGLIYDRDSEQFAIRRVGDHLVLFAVSASGFRIADVDDPRNSFSSGSYIAADCSGSPLYSVPRVVDAVFAVIGKDGTAYYPSPSTLVVPALVHRLFGLDAAQCATLGGVPRPGDLCCGAGVRPDADDALVTALATLNVSSFGLVAPFHLDIE